MRTRLMVLGGGVAGIALLLIVWGHFRDHRPAARPTPASAPAATVAAPPAATVTQHQILKDIIERGLTPERAKLYFSMVVGPLPGVDLPRGGRDPTEFDGTTAISYLHQVWDSLTAEQKNAASRLVGADSQGRARNGGTVPVVAASLLPIAKPVGFIRVLDPSPAWDYQKMAGNADSTLAAFLNEPVLFPFDVSVQYGAQDQKTGTEYAHTWSWTYGNVLGWDKGCHITVWNQKFQGLDENDAQAVLTHEMFHCYQQRRAQTASNYALIRPWIADGEATWAMATVVPVTANTISGIYEGHWNAYVFGPQTKYWDRGYDGVGVFGHASDVTGDAQVWPRLMKIVDAAIAGTDADAFAVLIQGNETAYYTSWGSSYFMQPAAHWPWGMHSPGHPPDHGPAADSVTVDAGTSSALTPFGAYESGLFQISGNADIVVVTLLTGYGRLHDNDFTVDIALDGSGPLALCLKVGGCKCPDGTPGASMITQLATAPLSVGVNGGPTTAQVAVAGRSLDDFCKKPDPKPLPSPRNGGRGGGGGGGGSGASPGDPQKRLPPGDSYGDTHLNTFDGVHYDFQVVGEYTLVRSTRDDFLVQIRQVPIPGPRVASVNQAVATRIDGQRMSFTLENSALVLRIDGRPAGMPLPVLKSGSLTGATTIYGSTYHLTWPDGTLLTVEQLGAHALNAHITPAAARHGALEGLLGNFDGSPDNDLLGAGDVRLGSNPNSDDLNHALADRWRVAKGDSLFDYKPGESTASFTDPSFPDKGLDLSKINNRADAENACREQSITDEHLLEDCILDLAATNDFIFGSQYAHAQQVLAARTALLPPTAPDPQLETLWMSGEILDANSKPEFHFDAKQGDVIWIHDPDCKDHEGEFHPVGLSLIDPNGKAVGDSGSGCEFGRRELPVTGSYTFRANFGGYINIGEITRYRIPIRFTRPTRRQPISYGQAVTGNIEQRAARDIYTFTGKEGDLVVLEGEGCQLGWMLVSVYDSQDHEIGGMGCRKGTYFKVPKDGAYQLVINSDNATEPGHYQFVFQGGKMAQ